MCEALKLMNTIVEKDPSKELINFMKDDVWQQNNLYWNYHVEQTIKKAFKRLYHWR